ncbi:hypothetical protein ACT8ZV_00305 [Nocardioides sp. MAHUQ-72]|uniref:hypothetical protein n=1 Tax=unclassified Nocardioides TaxID=2615069 RepID=UPI00360C985C
MTSDNWLDLHDALEQLTFEHGPQDTRWLAVRAQALADDPRITPDKVVEIADVATSLVVRPDGRVANLAQVLDGIVLTHRVRGSLRDRNDLWLGAGVHPFLLMAAARPLPLVGGGLVRASKSLEPALVGPPGCLPEAERGELIALTWRSGELDATTIERSTLAGPREELHVRELIAERCNEESWNNGNDPDARRGRVVRALALARLEDPDLLSTPHVPLDELLYDPLEIRACEHWRQFSASRQNESVSFCIDRMPVTLHMELDARARQYGMTTDQFVIALLGHLVWRTPFAEDMEPWDDWMPESRPGGKLVVLPGSDVPDGA